MGPGAGLDVVKSKIHATDRNQTLVIQPLVSHYAD